MARKKTKDDEQEERSKRNVELTHTAAQDSVVSKSKTAKTKVADPFAQETRATKSNATDKQGAKAQAASQDATISRGLAFSGNHFQNTNTAKNTNEKKPKTFIPGESLLNSTSAFPSTAQSRMTTLSRTNAQDSLVYAPTQARRRESLPTVLGTQGSYPPRIDMAAGAAWGQKNPNAIQMVSVPYRDLTKPDGRFSLTVNSAVNGVAGDLTQVGATAMEGWASISSEDGFIQQAEIDLEQALMEQEAYLENGFSMNDPVMTDVNSRVERCRAALEYYKSGQHKQDYANYRQSVYDKADNYYITASELEAEAKDGLTPLGSAMVDGGIAVVETLFDSGAGLVTGIPSIAYTMLRNFGDGAHKSYKNGWGVDKQIGDGLKSAVTTYLSHKIIDKGGIIDTASKSLSRKIAREIGGSKRIIEVFSAIPLQAIGVELYTKIATFADRLYDFATKGNADDTSIKQFISDLEDNLMSSGTSYLPDAREETKKWIERFSRTR